MITIEGKPGYVYYEGVSFTVEWYMDAGGRMKAKEYYDSFPKDEQERLDDLVKHLANSPFGTRMPKTIYNEEDAGNKIYALKSSAHRFFNFMTIDQRIIIVNAYRKHSQQMTKKDLNLLWTVVAARNDYLRSTKEGTYYDRIAQS